MAWRRVEEEEVEEREGAKEELGMEKGGGGGGGRAGRCKGGVRDGEGRRRRRWKRKSGKVERRELGTEKGGRMREGGRLT